MIPMMTPGYTTTASAGRWLDWVPKAKSRYGHLDYVVNVLSTHVALNSAQGQYYYLIAIYYAFRMQSHILLDYSWNVKSLNIH